MCKDCVYYKDKIDVEGKTTEHVCMKYKQTTYPQWDSCKHLKRKDDNVITEITNKVYDDVLSELRW